MAAASRYLPDVLPLQRRDERGLLHHVGVSEAQLQVTRRQNGMFEQASRRSSESGVLREGHRRGGGVHLALAVAAPGVDVAGGGQRQHVFTAHSDVRDEQALQGRDHLRVGLVLQHGVWQADQALWRTDTATQRSGLNSAGQRSHQAEYDT